MIIKKILILGNNGFIGRNIKKKFENTTTYHLIDYNRDQIDFLNKKQINSFFEINKPEIVINCCGIVGSSEMNKNGNDLDILNNNIILNINILECCRKYNIQKIITFSTYRIFGNEVKENYSEDDLKIELTSMNDNIGYLFSKKIMDIQLKIFSEYYNSIQMVCLILPNVFGKYDKFDINGRIVPAIIEKIKIAKVKNKDLFIDSNANNTINLIYVDDIVNIVNECVTNDTIEKNIIIFNKNGVMTIEELSTCIKQKMNYQKNILFSKKELLVSNNIMKPDISKFLSLFSNFQFSNISDSIEKTIEYYYTDKC